MENRLMPLHNDDPGREVVLDDGRVIRNLSDDEYAATLSEGEPHPKIPADVLADALSRCEES